MYTNLFIIITILAFIVLIKSQPVGYRTIFEPNVLILILFSLCYLVPTLAIVLGEDIVYIDYPPSIEQLSLYGFLFVLSLVVFRIILSRVSCGKTYSAKSINIYMSPQDCLIGFILIFLVKKLILISYGVGESDEYSAQYLVRASIPTLIAQGIVLLNAMQWMFVFLLLASGVYSSSRKYSLRFIFFIFCILLVDMFATGSRSQLVTFSVVIMLAYTFFNRPVGLIKEIIFSSLFIVTMGIFSLRRSVPEGALDVNIISYLIPREFINIYRNALHMVSISDTSQFVPPPGSSYLEALITFIPKQINEGKWSPASWYVGEYYPAYSELGGGLAFGIIPEAIINWGLISIVFQAFIIIVIFRIAYTYAARNRYCGQNIWVIFYLFSMSQIYQLIRSQSFSIVAGLFINFVVPFILLFIISRTTNRIRYY